jgi:hypothetical protein
VALAGFAMLLLFTTPVAAATDSDHDGLTDTFETTRSQTDPHRADTNGNGVLDSAEDPDGDRLGNLGEQRFGTDPWNADSDADGTQDGQEDANGNGITNAAEQDRRPVPHRLRPTLAAAPGDAPISFLDGCHSMPYDSQIHPCVYGDPNGRVTIAVFGDSHAEQWMPGLIPPAKAKGWRLVTLTKSACPSIRINFEEPNFQGDRPACNLWRKRAFAWIDAHRPDVVLISNTRGYVLIDRQGRRLSRANAAQHWKTALEVTLGSLPNATTAVVLNDTPRFDRNVPLCLGKRHRLISACVAARSDAIDQLHVDVEQAAATDKGAVFADLNSVVCPYDPCPVIIGHFDMWRNASHLTATYVRQLAPSVGAMMADVLTAGGPGPTDIDAPREMELADVASMTGPGRSYRD